MYSPKSGDPCYDAAKGQASWCQAAWRWNLDFVVDPHGNLTSYTYAPEANHYARGGGQNNGTGTKQRRSSSPPPSGASPPPAPATRPTAPPRTQHVQDALQAQPVIYQSRPW
ncbi:hypothetical protein ABZZ20_34000 [Streptomyces sp. NPDC006430]|uniref:hypothetical protein n=1 Tax=Streptomyces sp. NPDC006430 TaxID=3154299 RepID=UPI0033A9AAD1